MENTNPEAGINLQLYQIDLATHNVTISTQPDSAMVSSRDRSVVFAYAGYQEAVWTAASGTWTIGHGTQSYFGNVAMAGDGNGIAVGSQGIGAVSGAILDFMDSDTNIISRTGLTEYQTSFAAQIAGPRLNDAGSLGYVPVQFGTSSESVSFFVRDDRDDLRCSHVPDSGCSPGPRAGKFSSVSNLLAERTEDPLVVRSVEKG